MVQRAILQMQSGSFGFWVGPSPVGNFLRGSPVWVSGLRSAHVHVGSPGYGGAVDDRDGGGAVPRPRNWRHPSPDRGLARGHGHRPAVSSLPEHDRQANPVAIVGVGATGTHALRSLLDSTSGVVHVHDTNPDAVERAVALGRSRGTRVVGHRAATDVVGEANVLVLATPSGGHGVVAAEAVRHGASVVSLSDSLEDVRDLFELDGNAIAAGTSIVVGAGMAPGLTCVLARHAADCLDEVVEIAVAKAGTGGPACARQHHRAMKQTAWDWQDGMWFERRGGSGRDLVWFPPPIGARDSYKAGLPSPLLLQRTFPNANRISARVTATRRDRMTSRLPMLRSPHADGGPGAVRVEVRGRVGGRFETVVYAVAADPSRGAGVMASVVASALSTGSLLHNGAMKRGSFGLSELDDPRALLRDCRGFGLQVMTFDGTSDL